MYYHINKNDQYILMFVFIYSDKFIEKLYIYFNNTT